jgi:hypothetical protein
MMAESWRRLALIIFVFVVAGLVVVAFLDSGLALALTTTTALVTALVGVVWQLHDARQRAKQTLSYNYYERWSRAEMLVCRASVGEFVDLTGTTAEDRWQMWEKREWPLSKRLEVLSVFGFFEAGAAASAGCTPQEALELSFDAPPLSLG